MKKKFNLSFCASLINSDFFLTNDSRSSRSVSFLNVAYLAKQLKQFIRILNFLKSLKKKRLFVSVKTPQDLFILQKYFEKSKLGEYVSACEERNFLLIRPNSKKVNSFLALATPKNKNFTKICVDKKLTLLTIFDNNNLKLKNFSVYKVLTKLETIKKKIFLLGLIESVLKNSTLNKEKK